MCFCELHVQLRRCQWELKPRLALFPKPCTFQAAPRKGCLFSTWSRQRGRYTFVIDMPGGVPFSRAVCVDGLAREAQG